MSAKPSLCIVTTVAASVRAFYPAMIQALVDGGFEVTVVCADDPALASELPLGVRFIPCAFARRESPWRDLKALVRLVGIFRAHHFDIVQYSTPKASLLAALAGWITRAPVRLYLLWGLVYVTRTGPKRWLLRTLEKLTCRLSHQILPLSKGLVAFAIEEGLDRAAKFDIMHHGSVAGIDFRVYEPARWKEAGAEIRRQFGIPSGSLVIGTVARLTREKGINELVQAFAELQRLHPDLHLLLVGDEEPDDPLFAGTRNEMASNPQIHLAGWQTNPLPYYAAMDIFCLPTYREGFGEVNIEAQAMGLPVVSTDVIGPRETVIHGETGLTVKPQSATALREGLNQLLALVDARARMGQAGRAHVQATYDQTEILATTLAHRQHLVISTPHR